MKHNELELIALREEVNQMWRLVLSQLEKAKQSFLNNDIELAHEIIGREKRVDAFDLKIDSDCENHIALYNPVAIDLRLILSLMKISSTLERIGDFTEGIARHVIHDGSMKSDDLTEDLQIEKMFDILIGMLSDGFVALESENTKISGKIIAKDEEVDAIYHNAFDILTESIRNNADIRYCLKLIIVLRMMERIGDHCNNIVEEIVFYVDAKVLRHSGKV